MFDAAHAVTHRGSAAAGTWIQLTARKMLVAVGRGRLRAAVGARWAYLVVVERAWNAGIKNCAKSL
jgi:hypothetical protein